MAQTGNLVPVYRWFHPGDKDWITLRDGEIDDWKLGLWGYRDKTYSFSCSLKSFPNSVAIYRWFHPTDKDWITLADGEIPEYQLGRWGYQDKTFQFYAWR